MSAAGNNSSKLSNNSTDIYEEELMTWLQYPIDDAFERNYCSDLFGEWPPTTAETAKAHPDVNPPAASSVDMGINPCAGSGSSKLPTKKKMGSKPLVRSPSNAEEALALGAERAAGRSSQLGLDAFNKVRTSMKPQASSQRSTACSSLKAFDDKNRSVKSTLPVPSVPYACKPIEVGAVLTSPTIPRLYMPNTLSKEKTKHATSESTTFTSKRSRKDFETQSQLSHTQQSGSSRITEDERIERGNMTWGDRKFKRTPISGSEGSQTSMSLSFKEVTYSGKHNLDDSEFLSEDADVDSMDIRKPCKSSSRRNRVAEVHNLSERNRRNRINEKLKALQDLIPNSCKTDKASMLDEAIEYTKTLQMQLQMVSMRSGMNVSPIGMPMALPQTPLHMAPIQSVGLGVPIGHAGMGMGLGVGMDIGFPVNLPQYCAARPFQAAPATMSQYGMPFQNGSVSRLQNGFPHMGFVPSQSLPVMQKLQELPDETRPTSPRTSYAEQCKQQEQGQDLGHPSLNHKHEAHNNEQEGISGQKDWKRR